MGPGQVYELSAVHFSDNFEKKPIEWGTWVGSLSPAKKW
jgi:hypothetical protein